MNLNKILKNAFLVVLLGLIVTACATKKSVKTTTESSTTKQLRLSKKQIQLKN